MEVVLAGGEEWIILQCAPPEKTDSQVQLVNVNSIHGKGGAYCRITHEQGRPSKRVKFQRLLQ